MISTWIKWGTVVASTAITLNFTNLEPVQAASFEFYFDDLFIGELSFDQSNLTGVGLETANLSQLENVRFSYFLGGLTVPELRFGAVLVYEDSIETQGYTNNTSYNFRFNDGRLVGLFGQNDGDNSYAYVDEDFPSGVFQGSLYSSRIYLEGDRYRTRYSGNIYIAGYDYESYEFYENSYGFSGGFDGIISFETIVPVEAIPEPFTILGTGTALATGAFFKRKIAPKNNQLKN